MNEQEEMKALQEELESLKLQFNLQYQKIIELQQRLHQLSGKPTKISGKKLHGQWSVENFIGLRLIHFIGIVVLVIGLSIGVKYAIDRDLISEGLRILLAYLAGFVLYMFSLRLRKAFTLFSAILFSGSMASLYFTTYSAHVYYNMFPFSIAFFIMVALTLYTVWEAIRYNRQEIALLGLVGAYGIPFLISQNADRADLFFMYISLINFGVVFLVVKKLWRSVGMAAQAITWLLFIGWATVRLTTNYQSIGILFMTLFFLIFHFSVLALKLVQKNSFRDTDVYQLILNNVALYLASLFITGLWQKGDPNLAMITLALCVVVSAQALLSAYYLKEEGFLVRALYALAFILFVMFIAFNWDGFTVTLLWLLTAVVVFMIGFRLRSVGIRMAAILLIGVTLAKLLVLDSIVFTTVQKVIAYLVLGILLLVVSFFYQKFRQQLFSDKE